MKPYELIELIAQWVGIICLTLGASAFWGAIVAGIVRISFDIEPGPALLFVGLPTTLIIAAFLFPRMPRIMGYE